MKTLLNKNCKKKLSQLLKIVLLLVLCLRTNSAEDISNTDNGKVTDKMVILSEMKQVLDKMFELWYPLVLDTTYGGYFSDVDSQWNLKGTQNKMIVTQARHVWSVSNLIMQYPQYADLRYVADHGYYFLKDVMWDKEYGGFYDTVNRRGKVLTQNREIYKNAYGNSFAIYALAEYYKLTGDADALELAKETFNWLEKHSFDPVYGGYFQFLTRDGSPFREGMDGTPPKDYNSSIHILECFTELYKVWPDQLLRQRLESLLLFIRDFMTNKKGYLELYFSEDLKHLSFHNQDRNTIKKNYYMDHVTYGHDVETAYLMLDASEVLGLKDDTLTIRIAKKMVDHALMYGIDSSKGGIYDGGYYFEDKEKPEVIKNTKEWWSQTEALNSFLLMSELFPDESGKYYDAFVLQWDFCKKYLIDQKYGGWYWGGIDVSPVAIDSNKGTIWKGNYHTSRSLINCIKRLSKLE